MESPVSPQMVPGTRIPKAPSITAPAKPAKIQSPVSETKLPIIKQTNRNVKTQTTPSLPSPSLPSPSLPSPSLPSPSASSPLSLSNSANLLTQPIHGHGTGTRLRRANSSMSNSNLIPLNETKFLRRSKSSFSESKRPKSQTLLPIGGTKLPKLQPNASETAKKHLKKGSLKLLPPVEPAPAVLATRENTNTKIRKLPRVSATASVESKLPRVRPQHLSLPLKVVNSADVTKITAAAASAATSTAVDSYKEPLGKSDEAGLSEDSTMDAEVEKTHTTTITSTITPTRATIKTDSSSRPSKTVVGPGTKPKAPAPISATKLPKASATTQFQATLSQKSQMANPQRSPPSKISPTTNTGIKIPKAQLSLTGLKSTKPAESKLPKTPTTPDESKLPKAIGTTGSKKATSAHSALKQLKHS